MNAPTLSGVIPLGDHVASLRALRDALAAAFDDAPAYAKAELARRLQSVMAELSQLAPVEVNDRVDDLAAARQARRAASPARGAAKGGAKRGAGGGKARG